jgi:hypothetical protein
MTPMRTWGVVLLCLACGGLAPPAGAASRELALEGEPTLGDAWGGVAIWSHWNATTRRYQLVQWRGGEPTPIPVGPSARILDASIGPGADGRPVVVYARCLDEGAPVLGEDLGTSAIPPSGCDIHAVDLATGRESAVPSAASPARSELHPSVLGRRVAFVTEGGACGSRRNDRRVRVWIAGPRSRLVRMRLDPAAGDCGRVDALRLTRRGVLVLWNRVCTARERRRARGCLTSVDRLLLSQRTRVRQLLSRGHGESGDLQSLAGPPALDRGYAYVAATTEGYGDVLLRVRLRDGRTASAGIGAPDATGSASWLGGGRVLVTRGGLAGASLATGCVPAAPSSNPLACGRVELLGGLRFHRTR